MSARTIVTRWLLAIALCAVAVPALAQQTTARLLARPTVGPAALDVIFRLHVQWDFRLSPRARVLLDYGDGTKEAYPHTIPRLVPHRYANPGIYSAVLTVEDVVGNRVSDKVEITVNRAAGERAKGIVIHAQPGDHVTARLTEFEKSVPVINPYAGEGLPLPPALAADLERHEKRERLLRKLRNAFVTVYRESQPDLLPDPNRVLALVYQNETLDDDTRDWLKQELRTLARMAFDHAARRINALGASGKRRQARRLLAQLRREIAAKYPDYFDVAAIEAQLVEQDRLEHYADVEKQLKEINKTLKTGDDVDLEEGRDQLTKDVVKLAEAQTEHAKQLARSGNRAEAAKSQFEAIRMWLLAAESSPPAERLAYLEKALALAFALEDSAQSPEQRALARLMQAQIRAKLGVPEFSHDAAALEERHQGDVEAAKHDFARVERGLHGAGADLYRYMLKRNKEVNDALHAKLADLEHKLEAGEIDDAEYDRRVAAAKAEGKAALKDLQGELRARVREMSPDQGYMFASLSSTREAIDGAERQSSEKRFDHLARTMFGIKYDEAKAIPRLNQRLIGLYNNVDDLERTRKKLAECIKSHGDCEKLQDRLRQKLNNVDGQWFSLYYDYQDKVHNGGNFNRMVMSPLSGRPIVVRRDADHRHKNIQDGFSVIYEQEHYLGPFSAEDVVQLSATTAAVLAAGLVAGPVAGRVAGLVAPAFGESIAGTAANYATKAAVEGTVFTASERYVFAPLIDKTALAGTDIHISHEIADDPLTELVSFGKEAATNTVMLAFFHGAGELGNLAGARAGAEVVNRTGNALLADLTRKGVALTYEMGGMAGWSVASESAAALTDSKHDFSWDRVSEGTLEGLMMLPGLKLPGVMKSAFNPLRATPEARAESARRTEMIAEFGRNNRAIALEAAKPNPDPVRLHDLRVSGEGIVREIARSEHKLSKMGAISKEEAAARLDTIEAARSTANGVAIGAELKVGAHGRVVDVSPENVDTLAAELAGNGARVTHTGEGVLVEDPTDPAESVFIKPRTYRTVTERRAEARRDRAMKAIADFKATRFGNLPESERAWFREKFTLNYNDLGNPARQSSPDFARRGRAARAAFEDAMKTAGVDVVETPHLQETSGRNAQLRFHDGRWRIEYDPSAATYLDLKEEASHFQNDVRTGRFRPGRGIAKSDAALAEVREASQRLNWQRGAGMEGRPIDAAINRLGFERFNQEDVAARGVGNERVDTLASTYVPSPPPPRRDYSALQRDVYSSLYRSRFNILGRITDAGYRLDQMSRREAWAKNVTDPNKRARFTTLYGALEAEFASVEDILFDRYARLDELIDRLDRGDAEARKIRAELAALPDIEVDLASAAREKIKTKTRDLYQLKFDAATKNKFATRYARASGSAEKANVSRELGENAIMRTGAYFTRGDVTDPSGLATRVKEAPDGIGKFLRDNLGPKAKNLLEQYAGGGGPPSPELLKALIADINKIARTRPVFDAKTFRDVPVTDGRRYLLEYHTERIRNKDNPAPDELPAINALALRTALYDVVKPTQELDAKHPQAGPALKRVLQDYERRYPGEHVTADRFFEGLYAGSGNFDYVFAIRHNGKIADYVIFEAKGGSAKPATRVVIKLESSFPNETNGVVNAEQGTGEHTFSTLEWLQYVGRALDIPRYQLEAADLINALNNGRLRFIYSYAAHDGTIKVSEVTDTADWKSTYQRLENQYAELETFLNETPSQ